MSDNNNLYLWLGAGAILTGGVLYYLSREGETIKLEPKHNKEFFQEVLEDLCLEYSCSYLFVFNILREVRSEKGSVEEGMRVGAVNRLKSMTDKKD